MAGANKLFYLAGIIDGEGWISIKKNKPHADTHSPQYFLELGVANTSERLMLWLEANFSGMVYLRQPRNPKWKPMYSWKLRCSRASALLSEISDILVIKSDRAKLAIRFTETIGTKYNKIGLPDNVLTTRESMFQEMKTLNMKGVQPWQAQQP